MNNNGFKTVAIIPAYNEENNIARVILQARQYVDNVIVCDDGSTDMTFRIAEALGAKVVRHAERLGKGEALRTLSRLVTEFNPDIIVTLDGDGQHDPDYIPMLLKPIEAGISDIVVGSRYVDGAKMDAPFYRRFGLHIINLLYREIAGVNANDTQSGFRVFSRKGLECLLQCEAKGYGIESEQLVLAVRNGFRVIEVPVFVRYKGLTNNSKKSPLLHGTDLILTLMRMVVRKRPFVFLELTGMGLASLGAMLGICLLGIFSLTKYFNVHLAALMIGSSLAGVSLVSSAVILNARILKRNK